MKRIAVYTASKFSMAEYWRDLFELRTWHEVAEPVARWPFLHALEIPNSAHFAKMSWIQDLEDIQKCDVLLLIAEEDHKLRGALIEAGMAIALGKHVIVVGEHPDYGTWQYHPLVHKVPDIDHARTLLRCMGLEL